MSDRCDEDVFAKGVSLCALDARSGPAEAWVQEVARVSGQRVDWHYSGGVAHVLVLGDHAKAMAAVDGMSPRDGVRMMCRYADDQAGLYRAGVTDAPEGAIAVVTTSGENEWLGTTELPSEERAPK
jgi:hypothetical protein